MLAGALANTLTDRRSVRRSEPRVAAKLFHGPEMVEADCSVLNVTPCGARIELWSEHVPVGADVWYVEPGRQVLCKGRVAWRKGAVLGIAFSRRVAARQIAADQPGMLKALTSLFGR
jgi:hypothetical protein